MKLLLILDELREINYSAANSLEEGLEETLTQHKLEGLGKSLSTANTTENLNSQLSKYFYRIKYRVTLEMRARWMVTALLQIKRRMRKINNHKKLNLLRTAIKSELKLDQTKVAWKLMES